MSWVTIGESNKCYKAVLRIHLILMRIRILDPHREKMDPDPGHFFKIYWIFLTKNNFQIFCFIFFRLFYPKTWWTIQKWGNYYNIFFSIVQIWVLGLKSFFSVFDWYFTPWIRIQEAKVLRIQRIRILSTVTKIGKSVAVNISSNGMWM